MLGMYLRQTQSQSHELSQRQLQKLDQKVTQRLALLQSLHGDKYLVEGECPDCGYKNTPAEVLVGFLENVNDFTTECKKCECRFESRLVMRDKYGSTISVQFFCQDQALHKLKSLGVLKPEEFISDSLLTGVYQSLMIHFGSLALAYKEIELAYPYAELENWKAKVRPFLGKMSDTEIAEIVGVKRDEVRKLRESYDIPKKGSIMFSNSASHFSY